MNYTLEQIEEAFDNISPLTKRAMYYLDVNEQIKKIVESFEIEDGVRDSISSAIQYVLIGLMKYEEFENFLIGKILLDRNIAHRISVKLKDEILNPIKERVDIESNVDDNIKKLEDEKKEEPPIPPYKKTEKEEVETKEKDPEDNYYEKSGIEFIEENKNDDIFDSSKITQTKSEKILDDSGIDLLQQTETKEDIIPEPETERFMMEGIEHPESLSNGILGRKLKDISLNGVSETDYSIPKITPEENKNL